MIDQFHKVALKIRFLKIPAIVCGAASLALFLFTLFTSNTHESDRYLIPSIVGFIWSLSSYAFIENFGSVPVKPDKTLSFFGRIKRRFIRLWYWLLGIAFVATSAAVLFITFRASAIWLRSF